MRRTRLFVAATMSILIARASAGADQTQVRFNFVAATPLGSWQTREQIRTAEDGSKKILQIKASHVGSETRGGEPYAWIELELKPSEIDKKGKVKEQPLIIAKLLIRQWFFDLDAGNVLSNPFSVAQEVILQTEGKTPIRYYGKGLQKVGNLMDIKTKFAWKQVGIETATAAGGSFEALHLHGTGTADSRSMVIKKVSVATEADFWYSPQVPFGLIRGEIKNPDGRAETWVGELKSFGTSGAVSQITALPKDDTGKSTLVKIFGE